MSGVLKFSCHPAHIKPNYGMHYQQTMLYGVQMYTIKQASNPENIHEVKVTL